MNNKKAEEAIAGKEFKIANLDKEIEDLKNKLENSPNVEALQKQLQEIQEQKREADDNLKAQLKRLDELNEDVEKLKEDQTKYIAEIKKKEEEIKNLSKDKDTNVVQIKKLIDRGLKYISRPLSNGEFYRLLKDGLEYMTAEEARDLGLKTLADSGKSVGISEELYRKITNNI